MHSQAPVWAADGTARRSAPRRAGVVGWIGIGILGVAAIAASIRFDSAGGPALAGIGNLEQLSISIGFGIDEAVVTGQRSTLDRDVFDALDLGNAKSMLRFDSAAARTRIERLPWVSSATVIRVFPSRIEVAIVEREPAGVWIVGAEHRLVDATGRTLGGIGGGSAVELPRIQGPGAAGEIAHLLALLASHPTVEARLDHAEWVAERRWRLVLSGGGRLELPVNDPAGALSGWMRTEGAGALLERPDVEIDLRVADRVTIRSAKRGQT
jgi:cell division protein FtsQ